MMFGTAKDRSKLHQGLCGRYTASHSVQHAFRAALVAQPSTIHIEITLRRHHWANKIESADKKEAAGFGIVHVINVYNSIPY
jgi:hypothetical protein